MSAPNTGPATGTPAARTLAPYRQHLMGQPRRQVAGRVDGIARRTAQRHADGHDEHRHRKAPQAAHPDLGGVLFVADDEDDEHQQERADHLAEEVAGLVNDGGHRAEYPQFRRRIVRGVEMVLIIKVDQHGAAESADGQSDRDRGIEVRTRIRPCNQHAAHHGESPGHRNHDPAAVVSFRTFQDGRGHYPVAQQYEHQRSDELEQAFGEQRCLHSRLRLVVFTA